MIITEEVKNPVQQQKVKFADKGYSGVRGIPGRRRRRDHHIAEKEPFATDYFPFLLRKGDDIGRFVALQIVAINLTDASVANDEDRELGVRTSRDA